MTRDIERHIFTILQRRQKMFLKIVVAAGAAAILFVIVGTYFGWPTILVVVPLALIGPFAVSVITARCPRCSRKIHRSVFDAFRPLVRCSRCGLSV